MKFLYFLRTLESFGYLIRMIQQVVKDMIPFLVVMGVLVTAFSESIYALDRNKFYPDHVHLTFFEAFEFIYFNALGSLTMEGFSDDYLVWVLFFLCSLINMTVMLNLLISIISETYDKVASTHDAYALKERAGVVADLREFALFRYFVTKEPDQRNFLFIAIHEEAEKLTDEEINVYDVHSKVIEMSARLEDIYAKLE